MDPSRVPGEAGASVPVAGDAARGLGTFLGVFTPSILTILGVILFLRIGWVVGNTGLLPALLIVVVANLITLATAFSVAAIATNMFVGAGGAYYILSRSLGLEIGGAIGIPLFLAQTFSVTLYAFGFAESVRFAWPEAPIQPLAVLSVLLVSLVSGRSARLALRLQLPILALVALALLSLFAGDVGHGDVKVSLFGGVEGAPPFWVVFAVFFPAVTGLMAGVSLSGELRDPKRSIPVGTIGAVLTGFAVYLAVPVALALGADAATLVGDPLVWLKVSLVPALVLPGLWGAILSSAVGSMLGAPRTLEALADDGVVPRSVVGRRDRPGPGPAHLFATAIAVAACGLGNLNAVAPVLTMFFLTTYGMINLVAGLEQLSGSPSFRPTLRIPWVVALLGAVGCFWVMFLISPLACATAIVAEVGVYLILRRRAMAAAWGDLRYGTLMSLARSTLLQLRHLPVAARNWRPHILVFAGDIDRRVDLVRFAAWLNQDRGILTVSKLLVGCLEELIHLVPAEARAIEARLADEGIQAFAEVEVVESFEAGVIAVAQANGIAGISSNTVMFGWSEKRERLAGTLAIMRRLSLMGKSTVICRVRPRTWRVRPRRIDVWWGGLEANADLLLLLAYLLSANSEWRGVEICIRSIADDEAMRTNTRRDLQSLLQASRINARVEIMLREGGVTTAEAIQQASRDADIVFLGLREPPPGDEGDYARRLETLVGILPTVVLVRNASRFAGELLDEQPMGLADEDGRG